MIDKNFATQLAEDLYDFESKHEEEISKLELENKLAWFIIKLPLYYFLYNQSLGKVNIEKRTSSNKDKQSKQSGKELRILKFAIKFWLKWIKIRKSGKGKPLVISLTVDKRLIGKKYKNFLFDELFLNKIVLDPVIFEVSKEGKLLKPSIVSPDLCLDHVAHLTKIKSVILQRKNEYDNLVSNLYKLICKFLKEYNIVNLPGKEWLGSVIYYWLAEYKLYMWIFKMLRPSVLVLTDQAYTGKVAAANTLRIQVLEFQHGLMNKFYPHYTIPEFFKTSRSKMVLPNKIVVFGGFHRHQLLEHGFWDKEDIVVTGNVQIEEARKKINESLLVSTKFKILLPTQGKYRFSMARSALEQLAMLDSDRFLISIRPHPLEPSDCKEYYRSLVRDFPVFELIEESVSIFELIKNSNMVVGFDSTTLLEAAAVGVPSITLGFEECPLGIHTTLGTQVLESAIKVVSLQNNGLFGYLNNLPANSEFLESWKSECHKWGNYLFDCHYLENSRSLFASLKLN